MRRLLTLLFLAAVAVPAAAQDTPRPPRQPRAPKDSTVERGFRYEVGPEGAAYTIFRRGRLGVVVDLSADPARDSIGARIMGVTPGGAADKAGVRTGDVVVQFNDTRLGSTARSGDDDALQPGQRLVDLASKLHTGDTVHLELRRDNRPVSVTVVAGESGIESIMARARPLMELGSRMKVPFEGGEMNLLFSGAPLANLELVKVNPGLAPYFGTSEGILVVDAPDDSVLGLKAGDVILSIGGRKPSSPSHAFRILGTYDAGETVTFDVMRMKRAIRVTGKMPARHGWRAMPNSYQEFDGVPSPGWEPMDLWRGWLGQDLPHLLDEVPQVEIHKELPHRPIRVTPRHKPVST